MKKENKNHWYDGLFYDKLIAPNQDKSFAQLKSLIEPNSTLLDAGCGTGRLAFQIADKCSKVDGIDLSIKNVNLANKKLSADAFPNITFHHADVTKFLSGKNRKYDYAVLSYVIHEVDISLRVEILKLLSKAADKIIIIDYLAPRPKGFWSGLNEIVEFIAGKDHYRNFKTYISNGGIYRLAQQSGLKIISEIKNIPSTSHIVILSKQTF
jgi:SAM-dependent methyltransferase